MSRDRHKASVESGNRSALVLSYTPVAISVFAWQGKVDWPYAVVLAVGQAVGGWLGAVAALKRGATLIRIALAVVLVTTAVRLLLA